jgi:hypothetical protein
MMSAPLQVSCWYTAITEMGVGYDVPEGGQREPQEEDKLESEVKGKPVNDADKALNHARFIMLEWSRAGNLGILGSRGIHT